MLLRSPVRKACEMSPTLRNSAHRAWHRALVDGSVDGSKTSLVRDEAGDNTCVRSALIGNASDNVQRSGVTTPRAALRADKNNSRAPAPARRAQRAVAPERDRRAHTMQTARVRRPWVRWRTAAQRTLAACDEGRGRTLCVSPAPRLRRRARPRTQWALRQLHPPPQARCEWF